MIGRDVLQSANYEFILTATNNRVELDFADFKTNLVVFSSMEKNVNKGW